jgi:hypothetical protein
MVKEDVAEREDVAEQEGYDFTHKDPKEALTQDELDHFEEGMQLKNTSDPANAVDFARAVQSVIRDMDSLLA